MPTIKGSREAKTTGATAALAVLPPPIGARRTITTLRVNNTDTTAKNVAIRKKKGIKLTVQASDAALAVSGTLTATDIVLSEQDETVEVILGGAVTTRELDISASFEDETQ